MINKDDFTFDFTLYDHFQTTQNLTLQDKEVYPLKI